MVAQSPVSPKLPTVIVSVIRGFVETTKPEFNVEVPKASIEEVISASFKVFPAPLAERVCVRVVNPAESTPFTSKESKETKELVASTVLAVIELNSTSSEGLNSATSLKSEEFNDAISPEESNFLPRTVLEGT